MTDRFSNLLSWLLIVVLFLPFAPNSMSAQQPMLKQPIPMDPAVVSGKLDNGLAYFIRHNPKPENRAELRLVVAAGSMQEDDDQLGLAHFIEHMAFNGTRNFAKNELVDFLELAGTRFGPDLNAYTSFDETVYMLQTRTDSAELLDKGLLILEDWAAGVTFEEEEIDKERGVVISEWRSRLSPDQRMQQKTFPVVYKGSRYAERLPIGDPEIIENADYETIRRYYRDWYRPDLMAVIIVGDVDVTAMEAEIVERFSKLQTPAKKRKKEKYSIPRHEETRTVIVTDPEASFTTIQLSYKHDETKIKDRADYRDNLMHALYNRMLNARLLELRQQPDPPFTFAFSGYGGALGDLDNYFLSAFVPEGGALRGLEAVYTETQRALRHGFTETELERAKLETLRAAEKSAKEADKTESNRLASGLVYYYLRNSPFPDAKQQLELAQLLLPTIELSDIDALPEKWIIPTNRTLVVSGPEKAETPLPTEEELLALLESVEAIELDPYVDEVSDAPLLDKELGPANIVGQREWKELGLTEWTLANGVKVLLKPTDFKNDEILFTAFSPGGHSLYSDKDYFNAANAAGIIDQSGIGAFSLTELNKKLAGKRLSVRPYISELNEGFSGNTSPDDVETLMQLIYLYFTAPRYDEDVLQSFIAQQKSILDNIMANPYYFFSDEKSRIKYGNHPREIGLSEQLSELEKLDLKKIHEIYRDRFGDAGDFTFIFVGNFDPETFRPLVQRYLGNLPTEGRWETWKDVGLYPVDGKIEKTWIRGQAPKALVEMVYHGDFEYTPENRYEFSSMISLLRIKLRESMREDQGGVYGVSVRGFNTPIPKPTYTITLSFNAEPERVDELIATAKQEIAKMMETVEEKDLKKVKETQRQSHIKGLKENSFWLGQLSTRYRYDIPMEGIELKALEEAISKLDTEDVKAAAKRYLGTDNYMQFVLLPEQAEEEKE